MKKKIALLTAFILSAAMLTACGSDSEEETVITRADATTTTADISETEAPDEQPSEPAETTPAETDAPETDAPETDAPETDAPETDAPDEEPKTPPARQPRSGRLAFGEKTDLTEVMAYDLSGLTSGTKAAVEDCLTYKLFSDFDMEKGFYMGLNTEIEGWNADMFMAMKGQEIAMKMVADGVDMHIIFKDGKVTMYDSSEELDSALVIRMLDPSMFEIPEFDSEEADVFEIEIGGQTYRYEYSSETGLLYDPDGNLCRIYSADMDAAVYAFSPNVPSDAFDVPAGDYTVTDLTAIMAGLLAGLQ